MADNIVHFDQDTPKIEQAAKVRSVLAVNGETGEVGAVEFELLVNEAGKRTGDAIKVVGNELPTMGEVNKRYSVTTGAEGLTLTYGSTEFELNANSQVDMFWDGLVETWEVERQTPLPSVPTMDLKQAINRRWVDALTLDYNSLTDVQKQIFTFLKDIRIVGFSETPEEIGIFSFILNHSTFKYRIGLRMKKGEGYVDTGVIEFPNFDNPINLTIDGVPLTVKIDVEHLDKLGPDADRVIISTSGAPFINLSPDCFVDNLQDFNAIEEDIDIINNTVSSINSELTSINSELMGLTEVNILKNPRANYSNAEKRIISSIKNIEFYNVPTSIAKDDIFVRAFSADAEVGSGRYGRQIYLANRRIYQETSNWNAASILITGLIPCDFQEHSFDVTVASGAMAGLRIRMTVDYSVFTDVAPFSYTTDVNNKVTFNLQKTGDAVLDDRVSALEDEVADLDTVDSYTMPMRQRNVAFVGSSNVWGDGFLFYSYLKAPIEWLFKSSGKFNGALDVTATGATTVNNTKKLLGDNAVKITGVGSEIKFKHRGSELNICQVIERTSNFAVVGIYEGATKIAEFTNHNDTVGSGSKNFTGNGTQTKFELDRCFTYDHSLTVNGQPKNIILNTQGISASIPSDVDCMVIRSLDVNGKVIHSLWFKVAPSNGDNIVVSYQYGETICFVKSTVGETSDGTNESPYGDGTISYDPTNPSAISTGLDFRLINEKSFIKYWFDTDEERDITLKIERGTNPYFTFNFSSSVYHNVMNSGIGGWTAAMFNSGSFLNRAYWNIADHFSPDMVTIGLTGNDDWSNFPRKINRVVNMTLTELREYPSLEIGAIEYQSGNDTYDVTINSDIITEITSTSLKASSIIGSSVSVGDFARIGTYTGDLRQVQTRRIETVDLVSGEITWVEPLHLNEYICLDSLQDLVGQDVSIRSIDEYMTQMNTLIENILKMVPKCKICLFNVYYVDMWNRNVSEYTYIQQWIADKFKDNVFVLDAWKYARDYVESSRKSRVINETANGTNELLFTSPSSNGHWEGIEVWVNDRNVYGKDCYVQTGWLYTVDPAKTGADLNWIGSNAYLRPFSKTTQMKLIWKDNAPSNGTAVQIRLAFRQWSSDYAHPNDGDYISNSLGRAMIYAIENNTALL